MPASAYTLQRSGTNCIKVTYYNSKDQDYLGGRTGATAVAYEIKDLAERTRWNMKCTRNVNSIRNQIQSTVQYQYMSGATRNAKSLSIYVHLDEGNLTWLKTLEWENFNRKKTYS